MKSNVAEIHCGIYKFKSGLLKENCETEVAIESLIVKKHSNKK